MKEYKYRNHYLIMMDTYNESKNYQWCKKKITAFGFSLSILLLLQYTSFSRESNFKIGMEVGPTLSKNRFFHYTNNYEYKYFLKSKLGVNFGVTSEFNLSPKLLMTTNIEYVQKGSCDYLESADTMGNPLDDIKLKIRFNYMNFPVFIKYQIDDRFYLTGGAYGSMLLASKMTIADNLPKNINIFNIDYGVLFGVGHILSFNKKLQGFIELKGNYGMYKIPEVYQDLLSKSKFWKNYSLDINFGCYYLL